MSIINSTSFTSVTLQNAQRVVLNVVSARPDLVTQVDPPGQPGELVGFYNETSDRVELFCLSAGGTFWKEVG